MLILGHTAHLDPPRSLCSSNTNLLTRPADITSNFSSRTFSASAPSAWNSLPVHIRSIDTLSTVKRHLKFHLFQSAFAVQSCYVPAPQIRSHDFWRYINLYVCMCVYVCIYEGMHRRRGMTTTATSCFGGEQAACCPLVGHFEYIDHLACPKHAGQNCLFPRGIRDPYPIHDSLVPESKHPKCHLNRFSRSCTVDGRSQQTDHATPSMASVLQGTKVRRYRWHSAGSPDQGSTPGLRWGLRPQTPVIGSSSARSPCVRASYFKP